MRDANSENIQDILKSVVANYNSFPSGTPIEVRKKAQEKKLKLENSIQSAIVKAYSKGNPKVTHFYNNTGYNGVPLWAVFEILTLGDFANLLSCLTFDTRDHISSDLGMNIATVDTSRELVYRYLYTLKDLRNAVAHNAVVFDTRFRSMDPSRAMKQCLKSEFGLPYINFKTIGDYLILICYYLKILKVSKTEIKAFIREFEKITDTYKKSVDTQVSAAVIHPDLAARIALLKIVFRY